MKLTFEKILISILLVALSVASCIIGLYLLFNTKLQFKSHIIFTFVFVGVPVLSVLASIIMFRKPVQKEKTDQESEAPAVAAAETPVIEEAPAAPEAPAFTTEQFNQTASQLFETSDTPAATMNFDPETGERLN